MEANQRVSPLCPVGAARSSWEDCSACEPGSRRARGSGCSSGAAAAAQDGRWFPGAWAPLLCLRVRCAVGMGGGMCNAAGKSPLLFSPGAEAAWGAPAFAKLTGQFARALVCAGPVERSGAWFISTCPHHNGLCGDSVGSVKFLGFGGKAENQAAWKLLTAPNKKKLKKWFGLGRERKKTVTCTFGATPAGSHSIEMLRLQGKSSTGLRKWSTLSRGKSCGRQRARAPLRLAKRKSRG